MKKLCKVYLIFGIVFSIAFVLFVPALNMFLEKKAILQNGVETMAVFPENKSCIRSKVGNDLYALYYVFTDEKGVKHEAQTDYDYIYDAALYKVFQGKIAIKYDPVTFKSMPADTNLALPSHWLPVGLCLLGMVLDTLLWVAFIKLMLNSRKEKLAMKNGREYTARFVCEEVRLKENYVTYYRIRYSWVDENGKVKEGVTSKTYTESEVLKFKTSGFFKIMVDGNNSAIVEDSVK